MGTGRQFSIFVLVGLVILGYSAPGGAVSDIADFSNPPYSHGGIQWVVQDPVDGNVIVGTGFSGGTEKIYDLITGTWRLVASQFVGEALYVVVHPRELQVPQVPPAYRRRIYMATENRGKFGYYDPTGAGLQLPFVASPGVCQNSSEGHCCGTSIGYWPSTNAIYFGFVYCPGGNVQSTHIYEHIVGSGSAPQVWTLPDSLNGGWVLIQDGPVPHLYNTAHDVGNLRVKIIRQDSATSYPMVTFFPLDTYPVQEGGAHWSHAEFNGGFYYSEFDPFNSNEAFAYRVSTAPRLKVGKGQSITFLRDTVRNQLFTFATALGAELHVSCSLDGINFYLVDYASDPVNFKYGPTGAVATVIQYAPIYVGWGHTPTAARIPSRAMVSVSTGTCR